MRDGEPALQKARDLCLSLPETTGCVSWGHPNFRAGKRAFVAFEWIQGRPSIAFKLNATDAERLARYLTRGPLPIDVVEKVEGGRLRVRTPPDPRTWLVEKILDPLDLIHALTTQIPDPGQHLVRYDAWYSNRSRGARAAERPGSPGPNRNRSQVLRPPGPAGRDCCGASSRSIRSCARRAGRR